MWLRAAEDDVTRRIRIRLAAGRAEDREAPARVVWTDAGDEVEVDAGRARIKLLDGWLIAEVALAAVETGRGVIQVVMFLGRDGEGDHAEASAAVGAGSHAALAARWGTAVRDAVWNGVLDVLEGAVGAARDLGPDRVVTGFAVSDAGIDVEIEGRRGPT